MDIKLIVEIIKKATKPLRHRVNNMVRLGKVLLVKDGKTQSVQVLTANNEVVENVKYIETYGITSKPISGSETVIFNIQGNATNNVVLNIGNRELRFKELKDGEVCMYDTSGSRVHLRNGSIIDVVSKEIINAQSKIINVFATETANITAENVNIKATNVTIEGETDLGGAGGLGVALLNDKIEVVIDKGSSAGTYTGKIITASSKVRAI